MRSRALLLGTVAIVACSAGVIAASRLGGSEAAQDAGTSLGLTESSPLQITLSGPLWKDRSVDDDEGAPNIAYLTHDEPLTIGVHARDGHRINEIGYRIDRQPRVRLRNCGTASCPTSAAVTAVPALRRLAQGPHRIVVYVRSLHPAHTAAKAMSVVVGGTPPTTVEGEPTAATVASPSPASKPTILTRRAHRIILRAQRTGILRGLLGSGSSRFIETGTLTAGGRRLGATVLLSLSPTRHNVTATVPGYIPSASDYRLQSVQFTATTLRDLLVDIDLSRDRIIAVEPGPRSKTSSWSPQTALTPTGTRDED